MPKNPHLQKLANMQMTRKDFLRFSALGVISLFGVFGIISELRSHASSAFISEETEAGTLTGAAHVISDSRASGGKVVQFGSSPAQNLLSGDSVDFEGGSLGIWVHTNNAGVVSNSTTVSHSGLHSMKIITAASNASGPYTSSISATPGTTYTLSLWAYTSTSTNSVRPGINFYNSSDTLTGAFSGATPISSNTWTPFSCTATAPPGTTYMLLSVYPVVTSSPTIFYIDDCSLVADPSLVLTAKVSFPVGVSMGSDTVVFNSSDHGAAQYKAIKSAGFSSIRLDAYYTTDHSVANDAGIRAALSAGLSVLIILDGYDISIGVNAFSAFCKAVVATYSALGCHQYEILNEENSYGNWDTKSGNQTVSPSGYAALLTACYSSIKSVDSKSTVIVGGSGSFSGSDGASLGGGNYFQNLTQSTWMSLIYEALSGSSANAFDAVAVHPYTYPALPTQQGGDNFTNAMSPYGSFDTDFGQSVRSIMIAHGDTAKPMWITEFGAPTGNADGYNTFVTEAQQAQAYSAALTLCSGMPYVAAFYCFTWNDDIDGDFGINDASYIPKPALAAIQSFI